MMMNECRDEREMMVNGKYGMVRLGRSSSNRSCGEYGGYKVGEIPSQKLLLNLKCLSFLPREGVHTASQIMFEEAGEGDGVDER